MSGRLRAPSDECQRSGASAGALQPGFAQRAARPGEALAVPPVEREQRHALVRGMDEPAVAEVDPRVADLARLRARAVAEEEHVTGLEAGCRDPPGARHLAAHLVRRPAA